MTEVNDPAFNRKRRKAIIQSQRLEAEQPDAMAGTSEPAPTDDSTATTTTTTTTANGVKRKCGMDSGDSDKSGNDGAGKKNKTQLSQTTATSSSDEGKAAAAAAKKKTQIRYDPDVPMSKEQLAAWRREARRVRNRESAAASRQRIRNRITELEDEVGEWKSKYAEAMERLQFLENQATSKSS